MRRMRALVACLALAACGLAASPRLPDGRTLAFVCKGRGDVTVVLEAGWAADSRAFQKLTGPLSREARVCAYDRAGAGGSSAGPLPRTPRAIAEDLWGGLDSLGVAGPVILVGHSAGGLYVRHAAALRPDRVMGLVLVDPTVPAMGPRSLEPFIARSRMCLEALIALGDPPGACRVARPADPLVAWSHRLSELEELLVEVPPMAGTPMIVLTAGTPPEPAKAALHAAIPGARQRVVEGSGHMMMFDAPEAIVAAVAELLPAES